MNLWTKMLRLASPTYSEREELLARFEPSWADCAAGLRTSKRVRRSATRPSIRTQSLLRIHAELDMHRGAFKAGDRSALLWALIICCSENVPLPYWLADAWIDVVDELVTRPVSLEQLLGLNQKKLRQGKRGKSDRDNLRHSAQLWVEASPLVYQKGLSEDAALKQVLRSHRFPFQIRKARRLYDERDQAYRRYRKATRGTT